MGNSFHNTISFVGDDLKKENAKAKKQEDLILAIFKANPSLKISPSMIHTAIAKKYNLYPPLTSVRRAITNLCGQMELVKTGEMVPGIYHLPENTWQLREGKPLPVVIEIKQRAGAAQGNLFGL